MAQTVHLPSGGTLQGRMAHCREFLKCLLTEQIKNSKLSSGIFPSFDCQQVQLIRAWHTACRENGKYINSDDASQFRFAPDMKMRGVPLLDFCAFLGIRLPSSLLRGGKSAWEDLRTFYPSRQVSTIFLICLAAIRSDYRSSGRWIWGGYG